MSGRDDVDEWLDPELERRVAELEERQREFERRQAQDAPKPRTH